jgi:hypothetical protein
METKKAASEVHGTEGTKGGTEVKGLGRRSERNSENTPSMASFDRE